MGLGILNLFAFLLLLNIKFSYSNDSPDCNSKAEKIGAALGFLLSIETLFCCYVLYTWVRNFRTKSENTNKKVNGSPKGETNALPTCTDADERVAQDQNKTLLENYQPLTQPIPGSLDHRPGYQSLAKELTRSKKKTNTMLNKMRRLLPKHNGTPSIHTLKKTASPREEAAIGGQFYSEPYENRISAVMTELKKGSGSLQSNKNEDTGKEDGEKLVYYHVLEDPDDKTQPPVKPLPFVPEEQNREDVYYYCDSETPEESNQPAEDDVYYSCDVEGFTNKPSRINSKKAKIPLPYALKEKSQSTAKEESDQHQPYYHVLDNQSECGNQQATNKNPSKPLNSKPAKNANLIQEMKNRVAIKMSGD